MRPVSTTGGDNNKPIAYRVDSKQEALADWPVNSSKERSGQREHEMNQKGFPELRERESTKLFNSVL